MKKLYILAFLWMLGASVTAQFVPQSLDFMGTGFYTFAITPVDSNSLWLGVDEINTPQCYMSYHSSVKTTNGGLSWHFHTFPDTGTVIICDVCAWDTSTAYYVVYNGKGNIWKTTDGGLTFTNVAVNQFIGGFANWCFAFSPDSLIAGGDPNNGYFEIQISNDAGNTWTRVPSANIPAKLYGENGTTGGYSSIGKYIWFSTSRGRCFRSANKGLNWTVTQLPGSWTQPRLSFTDSLRGVFWEPDPILKQSSSYNIYYTTSDGGLTWSQRNLSAAYAIQRFVKVPGVDGSFLVTAFDTSTNLQTTVLYTPNFFSTISVIQTRLYSSGDCSFLNDKSGWLGGDGGFNSTIYKFVSSLPVGIRETAPAPLQMSVIPNPSSAEAILKPPSSFSSAGAVLRILDMSGKELEKRSLPPAMLYVQLNALNYANGIYIIQVTADDGSSAVCRWTVFHK